MIPAFRNLSIRAKLIALMMSISCAIMTLVVVSFLLIEIRSERGEVEAEIASMADLIGYTSRAALVFGDQEAAVKTLDALKQKPEVMGAWLEDSRGEVFARYLRTGKREPDRTAENPPVPVSPGVPFATSKDGSRKYRLDDGSLLIYHPIMLDEEQVGALALQADLGKLDVRIAAFMAIGGGILLFACLAAFILASWLQRLISRPIADLTDTMGQVKASQDYSLRLENRSGDEIGLLVDGFNTMLMQIALRDQQLAAVNQHLERRVAERTLELSRANDELSRLLQQYRQAEAALRLQAQVLEQVHDSVITTDVDGHVTGWNRGSERYLGYSAGEALGRHVSFLYDEDERGFLQDEIIAPLLEKGEHEAEVKCRKKSGEYFWAHLSLSLLRDPAGKVTGMIGYAVDISERRMALAALRESEENYRSLFENSPISLWKEDFSALAAYFAERRAAGITDFAGYFARNPDEVTRCARLTRILDVNQKTLSLFGAGSKEEFFGDLAKIFTESSFSAFREILAALAEGRRIFETEGVNRTLAGEERHFIIRYAVSPGALETLDSVIVSLVDISERRHAEEALRILDKALETTRMGVTIANLQGEIVYTNPAEAAMHGYEIGELVGQRVNILGPPELRSGFPGANMQTGERQSRNLRKDGSVFPVRLVSDLVGDAAGKPLAVVTVCEDITERLATEEALRAAKEFAEDLIQTANVMFVQLDCDGRVVRINETAEMITGFRQAELAGKNWFDQLVPRERYPWVWEEFERIARNGEIAEFFENPVLTKAGEERYFLWKNKRLYERDAVVGIISFGMDITGRKETEAKLRASVEEKDVLLKEVHHRVKNNLQIISSLLNLQISKITDARTRAELNATRNRIRSMALIHAKLYQSDNLLQIDFAEYAETFSRQLRSLYSVDPERVKLLFDIDAVTLDVDVAIPCAMIVNELMTNALKYAFPEERRGEIRVALRRDAASTVLSVEDNGIGMPPSVDMDCVETLGLQLVRGLAQQLKGTVAVERNGGTRVVIRCSTAGR